ncbi:MAG: 4-demethylwyosine synthase TYW1 [Candidatus Aenigmatarchaeota archaeon]
MQKLEERGYRFIGSHSAVKICEWTRNAIRGNKKYNKDGEPFCYKQKFYGIASHRCLQISPSVFSCTHNCLYCWRATRFDKKFPRKIDDPKVMVDNAIVEQKKLLQGFWGSSCDKEKLREAMEPTQVAISLVGEPCLYPKLPELIDEILGRNMTAFLVSNGTVPKMVEKLLGHQPSNMYITLPAPNEKVYKKTCRPLLKDGWKRIAQSLSLLKDFDRSVIRLTLVKGLNFAKPEEYAKIIDEASPNFVEVKSFMSVGMSRKNLPYESMPLHEEIKKFSKEIERASGYRVKDEKSDSRVVLMTKI